MDSTTILTAVALIVEQRAAPLLGRVDGQSEGSRSQEGRKKEKRSKKKKKGRKKGGGGRKKEEKKAEKSFLSDEFMKILVCNG